MERNVYGRNTNIPQDNRQFSNNTQLDGMYPDSNSYVYDAGLQGSPVLVTRPVPRPRPRVDRPSDAGNTNVIPKDERTPPQIKPRPPQRVISNPSPEQFDAPQRNNLGDSIDSLPGYRKHIEDLIKENRPQKEKFQAACSVMRVQCSLNSKYESIELWDLLLKNQGQQVRKIPQAFTILEKYATNLLKDESERHRAWRLVQFSSSAYQNKVKFMIGATGILKSLGYTEESFNNRGDTVGLSFPAGTSSNSTIVLNIAVDLVIAQFEVEAMLMGEHPRSHELQTIEDVPSIYFPSRNPVQQVTADHNKIGKKTVDYALNKMSISMPDDNDSDVPQPIPPPIPPKKNIPRSPSISEDYKKQLALHQQNTIQCEQSKFNFVPPNRQQQSNEGCNVTNVMQIDELPTSQMKCLKCGAKQEKRFNFCSECGSSLRITKPSENEESCKITTDAIRVLSSDNDDAFLSAEEGWNCEHCTLVNSYNTNICSACYKTSSISRDKKTKLADNVIDDMKKSQGKENLKGSSNAKATRATMFSTNPLQHQNFMSPNEVQLDEAKLREARKRTEEELHQKKLKEQKDAEIKKQMQIQEQNYMKENAEWLVSLMKFSENHGYTVEESVLAQKYHNDLNEQLLLNWLENDWLKLIDEVVSLCTEYFAKDETVGAISKEEARELLLKAEGNKLEVVQMYAEKRKMQIKKMADLENMCTRKDILNALFEAGGNDEKARQILHKKQLHTFYQNLHKKSSPEDYDRLKDKKVPMEVKLRMAMVESEVSWGRAGFVFRLLDANVPGTTQEILKVIRDNTKYNYEQCLKFFMHECSTCNCEYSHNDIYVGLACKCELCSECYSNHIKVTISEKHVRNLVCPICFKPDIEDANTDTQYYYGMVGTQVNDLIKKGLLQPNIKDIFESNLLDFHLKRSENFRYCINCKNGFEWENVNQIRMQCDRCNARMCFLCKEEWMDQHEGTSCEDFKAWKVANDPESQEVGVQKLLHGRGIECPDCKARFELAQGGCMHFTCTECKYQFCSGCSQGFKRDGQCAVHASCVGKGIHTHHPRDCLYYIRDMDVKDLETLLNNHEIEWKKEYPPDMLASENRVCGVSLQKEAADRLVDEPCGGVAPENMSGLCVKHYIEYLVVLVNNNGIDPIEVMEVDKMNTVLQRCFKPKLQKNKGESDEKYKERLKAHVLKEVPLPRRQNRRNAPVVGGPPADVPVLGAAAAPGVGENAPP